MGDFAYTAHDVADALARLSGVAAARGCAVDLEAQDLQERWQAVAVVASAGQLDAVTLEHLRAVFNYVENVIISCGAPDSFDVYEVAFEAIAKIGFYLQGGEPRQLLMLLLENVHEVYDVLLSCVETYEWIQPGATGTLRLWMLQVVFACFGSQQITGRDLMELTDNDVSGAVSLISFILRCERAGFEMQAAAGRCLVELTAADSVFMNKAEGEDWQSQQIAKLTGMLNRHVNGLIKGLIQFEVVEAFGRCICQHQMSHSHTDVIVKHFLTTIHNSLLYCSENQKKLRQHLATQSTIVQDIMIPYVHNILPALYDNPACGPSNIEWQNLKSVLQTFTVVTFNINVFRPQLRDSDMLTRICDVPNSLTHISMIELLIKIAINVDFTKGPYADVLLVHLQGAFDALTQEGRDRLQRRLTSEQGQRLPFARSSTQACEVLAFALTPPAGEEAGGPAADERKARRKNNWRTAKNKARKRKRMFGMQAKGQGGASAAPGVAGDGQDDEDDSEDDDMPPLIPADNWEGHLGQTDETFVPSMAKCQLSGALMHDPVKTPDGYLFERAALEDWMQHYHSNPLTGAPLTIDEPPPPEVAPPVPAAQAVAPMPAPAPMPVGPSLLGDLPSLANKESKEKKKEKGKIRIESRSVVDCPDDMRCAIDGKVMINPVRSPYGHFFEQKTLQRWMQNCGSVCPVSQQPLRMEECIADADMKKKIVKFLKGQV
eukprot:CAMPEP_0115745902 /NCGR_PEP_ID=MMETSP0272-20121206/92357_1 /TAXON_ID=71861 /ORGANISM="Scrippsiella trochoidea, Strain CCMP3099" /LENGTH=716 /DNA_ID=CAMNT_0003190819 /DNA_START=158 /DNA_END=2308 /DNA_ORIENTATION=-